jgi:hypothetical protein
MAPKLVIQFSDRQCLVTPLPARTPLDTALANAGFLWVLEHTTLAFLARDANADRYIIDVNSEQLHDTALLDGELHLNVNVPAPREQRESLWMTR